MTISLLALVCVLPLAASFAVPRPTNGDHIPSSSKTLIPRQRGRKVSVIRSAAATDDNCDRALTTDIVTDLFKSIDDGEESVTATLVSKLEESYRTPAEGGSSEGGDEGKSSPSFDPLLGLFAVSAVLTAKPGDNPVGGKWTRKEGVAQKLFRTRATYQHLLPPANAASTKDSVQSKNEVDSVVAEAVNVISLEAFFGLIRLNVILRGDATPLTPEERSLYEGIAATKSKERGMENKVGTLSPLAVRADFDPPRIVFGKRGRVLNLNLGPRSGVVLDTTYCDNEVRVGKGGTSGTRFVFRRICANDNAAEQEECRANEWRALLARRPLRKSRAFVVLGMCLGWGVHSVIRSKARVVGSAVSILASLLGAAVLFSSGGIERDDDMNTAATET